MKSLFKEKEVRLFQCIFCNDYTFWEHIVSGIWECMECGTTEDMGIEPVEKEQSDE